MLQVRGDYVQPERLYCRRLASTKGDWRNHPTSSPVAEVEGFIASVRNNLGRLYYLKGDYDSAEAQYLEVAGHQRTHARGGRSGRGCGAGERWRGVPTRRRSTTGRCRSSSARSPSRRRFFPANHPSLATSSFNLAAVYFDQGNYRSAETLFQRALDIDERNLAPQHPTLAIRLVGLADVLRLEGEYARADPLYERALSIRERALGFGAS